MSLAIRLLGPVQVLRDGRTALAGGPTQRAVLAMLALRAGAPAAIDELVDGVWGESETTAGAGRSLWTHISRLRTVLESEAGQPLRHVPGGYVLDATACTVDALEFQRLLAASHHQLADGDADAAASSQAHALALWRGPMLMDLRDFPFAQGVVARYDELRITALEDRVEARLAKGEDRALVAELQDLVAEHPYRERLHGQLMVALYRAGQQAAALDAYRAARGRLAADLGIEPGPELEALHLAILQQADSVAPSALGSLHQPRPVPAPSRPIRLRAPRVLFGRDEQLDELVKLSAGARLLTLTGAGGTGKTALGLALVRRLAPEFRHGDAVVDLGAVAHAEQVLPAIAAALGVSDHAGPLDDELAAYLEEHRVVLLLDNLEHLPGAAELIEPLVRRSSGLIVATSRSALGIADEDVVEVPPLPVSGEDDSPEVARSKPSVKLFFHAATAAGGRIEESPDEIAAVGELCRALDGLPLAIEIVAAQTRVEAPGELVVDVLDRLPALASRTPGAPARQRTMDAAIGWSIDRLSVAGREHLVRLAIFSGSFTVDAAACVLGLTREHAIEILTELLDASLLMRQPSVAGRARFRLLQPIRGVARAHATAGLLADAAGRHAAFMVSEVDRLCPRATGIRAPEDLALLRAQDADLLAAIRHLATRSPTRSIEIVGQLGDYWEWTGREMDARRIAEEALRGGQLSSRAQFIAQGLRAMGARTAGRVDVLQDALERSTLLAAELGGDAIEAELRLRETRVAFWLHDEERGRAACRAAIEHARRAGEHRTLALALSFQVYVTTWGPETEAGVQEALALAEAELMGFTTLWVLATRSIALEMGGRYEQAMQAERAVLGMARRFQSIEPVTLIACNFGERLIEAGRIAEARAVVLGALTTADRIGHRIWAATAVEVLGELEAATGRWVDALLLVAGARTAVARMGMTAVHGAADNARAERLERWLGELIGEPAQTAAVARASAFSYRDLVDLALELNGVAGCAIRPPRTGGGGEDILGGHSSVPEDRVLVPVG